MAKDLIGLFFAKNLIGLLMARSHRPSLRPPRRHRLLNPAIPWEGAMTIAEVLQFPKYSS